MKSLQHRELWLPMTSRTQAGPDEPTALIVGMARAGTTWCTKVLDRNAQIAAFGESCFWGRKFKEPDEDGRYSASQSREMLRDIAHSAIHGWQSMDSAQDLEARPGLPEILACAKPIADGDRLTPRQVFSLSCSAIASACQKPSYIEKTPHHLLYGSRILDAYPDMKFIICVRDPYSTMLSYKFQAQKRQDKTSDLFRRLYHPLAFSIIWRKNYLSALNLYKRHPDKSVLIKHEEVEHNADMVIDRLDAFLGLEPTPREATRINSSFDTGSDRPELDVADLFWINLIAGKQIAAYGCDRYPVPLTLHSMAIVIRSAVRLLPWGIYVIRKRLLQPGAGLRHFMTWLTPTR